MSCGNLCMFRNECVCLCMCMQLRKKEKHKVPACLIWNLTATYCSLVILQFMFRIRDKFCYCFIPYYLVIIVIWSQASAYTYETHCFPMCMKGSCSETLIQRDKWLPIGLDIKEQIFQYSKGNKKFKVKRMKWYWIIN